MKVTWNQRKYKICHEC